jgi:hypothetical protein
VDFRSARYNVFFSGTRYDSDLIVAIVSGWVVEVRSTFLAEPVKPTDPKRSTASLQAATSLFMRAQASIADSAGRK